MTDPNTLDSAPIYPFAALVGQEKLGLALLLNAINPGIGGVLIRGEKGTAKSTAARGVAALLPSVDQSEMTLHIQAQTGSEQVTIPYLSMQSTAPFVTLPLGASDDRLIGSLNIEAVLQRGERQFELGLLAEAHQGVLYVDEVNLLADHLVDVLLDVAALGTNIVEREGVSVRHPAKFMLIGTMNPEEGELRPQLLDRFGLMVEVHSPSDPKLRAQVVRRRIAYEANPGQFATQYQKEEQALKQRIKEAQVYLPKVSVSEGMLDLISQVCAQSQVDGLRADITMYKTAQTIAAWENKDSVTIEDIRLAAEFVLPHRRRRQPFEDPALSPQDLDDLIEQAEQHSSQQKEPSHTDQSSSQDTAPTEEE
ncbi:MAG: ATP-binding protein [Chloroflexota bacterium]